MSRFRAFWIWLLLISAAAAQAPVGDPYFNSGGSQSGADRARGGDSAASSLIQINRREFALPVQLHDRSALELRLFVSEDRGATWRLHSRARPDVASLAFTAPRDGEFWFHLYTMTPATASQPVPIVFDPALRLSVDTQRPVLDAEVFASEAGGIAVRWSVEDENLEPEGIVVEYRPKSSSGVAASWKKLTVSPPEPSSDPFRRTVQLWPESSNRNLEVRVAAVDRAGNVGAIEREVRLEVSGALGAAIGEVGESSARAVSDLATAEPTTIPWTPPTGPSVPAVPEPNRRVPASTASSADVDSESEQGVSLSPSGSSGLPWATSAPPRESQPSGGAEDAGRLPPDLTETPGDRDVSELESPVAGDLESSSQTETEVPDPTSATPGSTISSASDEGDSIEELPPPENETDLNSPATPPISAGSESELEELGEESRSLVASARVTKERRFRLVYDLDSVGTAGIAKVQLWMTADQGSTWMPWNEDPDCESPISVELPGEGIFGFQLVVTARNGLAGQPPESGQPADMWVIVDQKMPTARIVEAPLGEGVDEGRLMIHWEAQDEHLGKRPVTLHFGASHDGPWNVLAAGLPNTGYYPWTIVPSLPRQVFLRLEVRDRAGNVTFHTLDRPVDLTSLMPRGTLRGFLQSENDDL